MQCHLLTSLRSVLYYRTMRNEKYNLEMSEAVPSASVATLLTVEQLAQILHMAHKGGSPASAGMAVSVGQAFFTRREAAKIAGVSVSTLDRMVKAGEVPFRRIRGRVLFPKGKFIAWCSSDQMWIDSMGMAA